jgi:hypothetical protein
MKLRLFTGLALVLALGGCASYGYVDEGGGYYSGGPSTEYRHVSGYGGYGYGYGVYGSGSPFYSQRYNPGWALGLGYGYPYYSRYSYYPRYPYAWGGGYHRPPPPRPPRPPHPGGEHHGDRPDAPDRPPPPQHVDAAPPLDRAPWRDLERMRNGYGAHPQRQMPPDRARAGVQMVPRADGETWPGPSPAQRRPDGPRPGFQRGEGGPYHGTPAGPRISSREAGDAVPRQMQPRPERQMEPRDGSRPSAGSRNDRTGHKNETGATENP